MPCHVSFALAPKLAQQDQSMVANAFVQLPFHNGGVARPDEAKASIRETPKADAGEIKYVLQLQGQAVSLMAYKNGTLPVALPYTGLGLPPDHPLKPFEGRRYSDWIWFDPPACRQENYPVRQEADYPEEEEAQLDKPAEQKHEQKPPNGRTASNGKQAKPRVGDPKYQEKAKQKQGRLIGQAKLDQVESDKKLLDAYYNAKHEARDALKRRRRGASHWI